MNNIRKIATLVLSILLVSSIAQVPLAFGKLNNNPEAVILSLSDDVATDYTIGKIKLFIPSAIEVSIDDKEELQVTLQKTSDYIIYVGHGSSDGLKIGSSSISWSEFELMIEDSPSPVHLIATCYSGMAKVESKFVFGFERQVDVDEAAMWVTGHYYGLTNQREKIPDILQYFTNVLNEKAINPESHMSAVLDYTTQYSRGWWWGVYPGTYQYPIRYTQPDVYIHYPWVTPEGTAGAFSGDGFGVFHISKSTVDQANLGLIISTAAGTAGGGIAVILAGAGSVLSLAVAGIIAVTGGVEAWIVATYVADSAGAAWMYFNNLGASDYYNIWVDWKLGALPWMNGGLFYGIPYCYCLWYGDNYLGIDGI